MIKATGCDPLSKIDSIISCLKSHAPQITAQESDFIQMKITSSFGEELWIELSTEFSIFFGDWHAHYSACDAFLDDLTGILESKKCTVCAYRNDRWCGSCLSESETPDEAAFREEYGDDKIIKCNYWDQNKNIVFDAV